MWGFIKGMFGGGDTTAIATTAAQGIYNGIDMLIYTDEEKAEAMAEGRKLFLSFVDKAYDQNGIRSVTRRWLAFLVVAPTIFLYMAAAVSHGVGIFLMEPPVVANLQGEMVYISGWVNGGIEYAQFLFSMAQVLTPWAGGVLVFYFGPHLMGAIPRKQ